MEHPGHLAAQDEAIPPERLPNLIAEAVRVPGAIGRVDDLLSAQDGDGANHWFTARANLDWYLADLESARGVHERLADEQVAAGGPVPALVRELRYLLMAASVRSRSGVLPAGLLGALVATGAWTQSRALAHALSVADPERRAYCLIAVRETATEPDVRTAATEAVMAGYPRIDPIRRSAVVAELGRGKDPDDVVAWMLARAHEFTEPYERSAVLQALAPRHGAACVPLASAHPDPRDRLADLWFLAHHGVPGLFADAEAAASAIDDPGSWTTLADLAPTARARRRLVATALSTMDGELEGRTLAGQLREAAAQADPVQLTRILRMSTRVDDPEQRARVRAAVLRHSHGTARRVMARTAVRDAVGYGPLAALVPVLPPGELRRALPACYATREPWGRVVVFTALAERCPDRPDVLDQALVAAGTVHPDDLLPALLRIGGLPLADDQADRYRALARTLPPRARARALLATTSDTGLVQELVDLAVEEDLVDRIVPHIAGLLTADQAQRLAAATEAIGDDHSNARGVTVLARAASPDDVLRTAMAISDPRSRIDALSVLVDCLPEPHRGHALAEMLRIDAPDWRVRVLTWAFEHSKDPRHLDELAASLDTDDLPTVDVVGALVALGRHDPARLPAVLRRTARLDSWRDVHNVLFLVRDHLTEEHADLLLEIIRTRVGEEDRLAAFRTAVPHLGADLALTTARKWEPGRFRPLALMWTDLTHEPTDDIPAEALRDAEAVEDTADRVDVLVQLASRRWAGATRAALLALAHLGELPRTTATADSLLALARGVDGPDQALAALLDVVADLPPTTDRAQQLVDAAGVPAIDPDLTRRIRRAALADVRALTDERDRALCVRRLIIRQVDLPLHELVDGVTDPAIRAGLLVSLAEHSDEHRRQAVGGLLRLLDPERDPSGAARHLSAVAGLLTPDELSEALALAQRCDPDTWATVAAAVPPQRLRATAPDVLRGFRAFARNLDRKGLLALLERTLPVLHVIAGEGLAADAAPGLADVLTWWPATRPHGDS